MMMVTIKKNKYFILALLLMIVIVFLSFVDNYRPFLFNDYEQTKENCIFEKDLSDPVCQFYQTEEAKEQFLSYTPMDGLRDHIQSDGMITTIYSTIEDTRSFSFLQYLSPMIIAIVVISLIHSFLHSGMFQNVLLREDYKKTLKKQYKSCMKVACLVPFAYLVIIIVSAFLTHGDIHYSKEVLSRAVFTKWKFDYWYIYLIMIALIQFIISLFYVNIAIYCCKKNQHKLTAFLMSYIIFIAVDLVIYVVVYALIYNHILGFKEIGEYFLISGYFFFNASNITPILVALFVSTFLWWASFLVLKKEYGNAEKVVLDYESITN